MGCSGVFEKIKRHFRQLNFVPESAIEVREGWSHYDEVQDLLEPIHRRHGWPDLECSQKEACKAEIRAALFERDHEHYSEKYLGGGGLVIEQAAVKPLALIWRSLAGVVSKTPHSTSNVQLFALLSTWPWFFR